MSILMVLSWWFVSSLSVLYQLQSSFTFVKDKAIIHDKMQNTVEKSDLTYFKP